MVAVKKVDNVNSIGHKENNPIAQIFRKVLNAVGLIKDSGTDV